MPPAENPTPLSVHRAFVVHVRGETAVAQGQVAGRVEHVVSGQATHFDSLQELLGFIAQVLAPGPDRPETAADPSVRPTCHRSGKEGCPG